MPEPIGSISGGLKVAFVGSCPSSRMLAPYDDPAWQIWACSPDNANRLPRVDRWFEIHGDLGWPENQSWAAPYVAWLNQQSFRIFAQNQMFIPAAETFPKDDLIRQFGVYFFTSTFAWMFAYALRIKVAEVGVFGIDMATDTEYSRQRAAFQHFLWLAAQRGVRVVAPDESDILQPPPLYGYVDATPIGRKLAIRRREIEEKIGALQADQARTQHHLSHLQGCIDDIDYVQTIWTGHQNHADDARHQEHRRVSVVPLSGKEG